ncbi:microtubule-actin cross-linking factor 1 isoform X6 [Xenopus laevis]|uniref:Microtubule-actin cross-linking factor 1 isoform X6 n=1 Tax=Xenopus laevis TaxID=8355 RepID=A0A8J1M9V0_XENLA|nr:microtubule-actin cross-linking factor 1 isoform X6 [Xenopus laevis]
MPTPSPLHRCTEIMGNSVSCVRKPKERRHGKGNEPHPGKKRRRFKRRSKGYKGEGQDTGDSEKESRLEPQDMVNVCERLASPGQFPSTVPAEEGQLLQVRETLHGEVRRALLLDPIPIAKSLPSGTTVIARIVENPAASQQRTLSTVVELDRTGNSRAILLPVKAEIMGDDLSLSISPGADSDFKLSSPIVQSVELLDKPNPGRNMSVTWSWGPDLSSSGYCSDPSTQPAKISDIYVSGESGDMSAKEKLLLWTQKVTAGYAGIKCTNFSSCWSDGKMFNAIIHRYRPDLVDMQRVELQGNRENLEQAFEIAESLGVTRLLDAEDVDVNSPDEKSVITYVSSIYDAFPKVPEGAEGISATEVDSRWLEYQERVVCLTQWIRQNVLLMSNKSFPQNPVELKALYNQYVHVKETEIPAKEQEKEQIQKLYQMLQNWIEFGRVKLLPSLHPNDVEEQWGKLILFMLEREKILRPAVERLELLLQIANRIQNGCLSCEEKLTLARNTLQSDAANIECGQTFQQESEVVQFLQESEGLLRQLQSDVQILRDEKYFQVEELAFRVLRIQDELLNLKMECSNLYRRGNLITSDLQPTVSLSNTHQHSLHTSPSSSSWRKPMSRSELVLLSSSEDEGSLRFVYELLAWVEEIQMKLELSEWGSDLPSVEAQLESQRIVHTSVEELVSSLREARSYEVKMSPNFRSSYGETLSKLETQYCKLRETSSSRLRNLQSLHDFVSQTTAQIIWLNQKEEEELAYDWSDGNLNIAAKKDYFTELMQELEEKQDVIQSLQETAELLSLENHPAKQTVEAYSAAVISQWQWVKQLCLCVEQHLKENSAYLQFFNDVRESEVYLSNLQDSIKRKYSCDRSTSISRLEDILQDSMDEKEQLIQSRSSVASLVGRSKNIVQLKPRNPEHCLTSTLPIRAICDYRQIEITISRNEECVLEDNTQRTKWKVISTTGNEAMVPSVCFLIPPPNQEAMEMASRVEQLYQKVMSLWHELHVNTKSVISWNYLRKDVEVVQSWNSEKLRALPLAECLETLSNLSASLKCHLDEFLEDSKDSQIFLMADRLNMEQEVDSCRDQCRKLVDLIVTEDKEESEARTYLSELYNIELQVGQCEQRLVKRIQSPAGTDADAVHEITIHISEQERMQEELKCLKSELYVVSERCDDFLHKSCSGSSTPNLRSQLDLLVKRMDQVYGLSSVFLEKLKTVDVVIRSLQEAEGMVKGFEIKLSQEASLSADTAFIHSQQNLLQQWLAEAADKDCIISALENDIAKSKDVRERLHEKTQERSMDVEHYQERAGKLRERWNAVHSQLETRQSELLGIQEALRNYRGLHDNLIQWIEETKSQQEKMKPGQSEDRRVLSEQLSQQTALVAEIEKNQTCLDECQTISQQYSNLVKEYELQLMTYRACVESQQKSPMKRRRLFSSSDIITQEFMDLRTRYTALVTLTTQHVKYISDALRRLEEEEKVLEEEKEKHVEELKRLTGWVSGLSQETSLQGADHTDLNRSISEQKALSEELLSQKERISEAVKSMQIFLAKNSDRLSTQEKEELLSQIQELNGKYNHLSEKCDSQVQQLHTKLAREAEQKMNHAVGGVIDLGSMEIFPIFWSMQRGLIDQDTGLFLLEAQIVLSGLIVPATNERLNLEEALNRNLVDRRLFECLQVLRDANKLVAGGKSGKQKLLSVIAAMEDKIISEFDGLKILSIHFAMEGFQLTSDVTDLEQASQAGLISRLLCQKLKASSKNLVDPNTAKRMSLAEIMQTCIIHESTGLRLLPVKQPAGGMVCLKSGKKVSIFRAVQEGLIDRQVAVRLLEAQLCAGGIKDTKTGHQLTVDEAVRHNLIDQDVARALLTRQLENGGIIASVTGQKITLDEAVKENLVAPKLALLVLESLGSFKGVLWPESGEILNVADALQLGMISTETALNILESRQRIQGLYMSEGKRVLSWDDAVMSVTVNENIAKMLQSAIIPDTISNLSVGYECMPELGLYPGSLSGNSSPHSVESSELKRGARPEDNKELISHLINVSYINVHSGQRLLLTNNKENIVAKLFPSASLDNSVGISQDNEKGINQYNVEKKLEKPEHLKAFTSENTEAVTKLETNLCLLPEEGKLPLGTHHAKPDETIPSLQNNHASQLKLATDHGGAKYIFKNPEIAAFSIKQLTIDHDDAEENIFKNPEIAAFSTEQLLLPDITENSLSEMKDGKIESSPKNKGLVDTQVQTLAINGKIPETQEQAKTMKSCEMSFDPEKQLRSTLDLETENMDVLKDIPKQQVASETCLTVNSAYPENIYSEGKVEGAGLLLDNMNVPCGISSSVHLNDAYVIEEEDALNMLSEQLMNGGIIVPNSSEKLLLNEAASQGIISSHTALKLMEKVGLFAGFFDSKTCDKLTIHDVIDEGLMDETLLQQVLSSDKTISGIVDTQNKILYSLQDALNVGLVNEEMAKQILEVQVITGGIYDMKRGKRISVTLASSLNLMQPSSKDDLIKLEKASKGKKTDQASMKKLTSLQIETSGITDPLSKKVLPVTQAVEQGFINRQEAIKLLTKQIADGGIIHHLSGMRLSVLDALKHRLIDHTLFDDLKEFEYLHQSGPHKSCEVDCNVSVQCECSTTHDTNSISQASTKQDNKIPYTDVLKNCAFDVLTGQRYLDLNKHKCKISPDTHKNKIESLDILQSETQNTQDNIYDLEHARSKTCSPAGLCDKGAAVIEKLLDGTEVGMNQMSLFSSMRDIGYSLEVESEGTQPQDQPQNSIDDSDSTLFCRHVNTDIFLVDKVKLGKNGAPGVCLEYETRPIIQVEKNVCFEMEHNTESFTGVQITQATERDIRFKDGDLMEQTQKDITFIDDSRVQCKPSATEGEDLFELKHCDTNIYGEESSLHGTSGKVNLELQSSESKSTDGSVPCIDQNFDKQEIDPEVNCGSIFKNQKVKNVLPDTALFLQVPENEHFTDSLGNNHSEKITMSENFSKYLQKLQKPLSQCGFNMVSVQKPFTASNYVLSENLSFSHDLSQSDMSSVSRILQKSGNAEFHREEGTMSFSSPQYMKECDDNIQQKCRDTDSITGHEQHIEGSCLTKDLYLLPLTKSSIHSGIKSQQECDIIKSSEDVTVGKPVNDVTDGIPQVDTVKSAKEGNSKKVKVKPERDLIARTLEEGRIKTNMDLKSGQITVGKPVNDVTDGIPQVDTVTSAKEGNSKKVKVKPERDLIARTLKEGRIKTNMDLKSGQITVGKPVNDVTDGIPQVDTVKSAKEGNSKKVKVKPERDLIARTLEEGRIKTNMDLKSGQSKEDVVNPADFKTERPTKGTAKPQVIKDISPTGDTVKPVKTLTDERFKEDVIKPTGQLALVKAKEDIFKPVRRPKEDPVKADQSLLEAKSKYDTVNKNNDPNEGPSKEKETQLDRNLTDARPFEPDKDITQAKPKDSYTISMKQACLEHEENLVSYLSMLRDIEVRLGPAQPVPPCIKEVQEQLKQAEVLDLELRQLMSPVSQELDFVKQIISKRPLEVPVQLLRVLEKDAKNLEKSLTSIKGNSELRVKQLQDALETVKGEILVEHKELESKLHSLLQWVKQTTDSLDSAKTNDDLRLDAEKLQQELNHAESLRQPLTDTRQKLDSIAFDIQFFISEQAQDLTPQQSRTLLRLLNDLQRSFRELSERLVAWEEVLQLCQKQTKYNTELKIIQERQAACSHEFEELALWAELTEKALPSHQTSHDLSSLKEQHNAVQALHKDVQSRGKQFSNIIKAAEDFLAENKTKMNPVELESFQKKLQQAKEQYHAVLEKTADTEKQLERALSTAVLEETKKSETAEELKVNLGKIESLLSQVRPSNALLKTVPDGSNQSIQNRCLPPDKTASMVNDLYERKKAQHQEMLEQQQNFILTIQSAQDFLDKHGNTLCPEERQQLQNQLAQLKEEYSASMSQAQLQLKNAQILRDEMQNFIYDHGEFELWLVRSEEELDNMRKGKKDCEGLKHLLKQQMDISEDIISHKGDLRYINLSGQKAIEAEKATAEQCKEDFEMVAGTMVKSKLEEASKRFSTLQSKCSKLGSHLNIVLDRYQQLQEGSDTAVTWLQVTELEVDHILSEPVASDPEVLQTQLAKAKSMQSNLVEHQVQVEKVHKALRMLLEIQDEPSPDCRSMQDIAESIDRRFQNISNQMSFHSDLLQKTVAQSQNVQDAIENLLQWLEEMENTLAEQKHTRMSSTSVEEALAMSMKLKQDISSRRGSMDATGEMVGKFMETADSAAASALQRKLSEVTSRFNEVCMQQRLQETALKEILPKVEKYEQLSNELHDFTVTRSRLLASGNQPERDITQFSEQIKELNAEIKQQEEHLVMVEQLARELSTSPILTDASGHLQKLETLKKDFTELREAALERESETLSCQESLEQFQKLVGVMRKWLKEKEDSVPSAEDSLKTCEMLSRLQQVKDHLSDWEMKGPKMAEITKQGSELECRIMEITASEGQRRGGSVLMATGSSSGNVNGYHTCQDLTGIQCDVSETSQKYENLGLLLNKREEQLSTMLENFEKIKHETNHMLTWLESKEKTMAAVNVSPTKSEVVKAQAKQNKEFLSELEQSTEKVESLKATLRDLLEKHPNSPEAENWKTMLENLNQQWGRVNQVTAERQHKLEESANQLATFQVAGSQLCPWLKEKELMMSVLGPLSVDPNMLNAQKQQVQFMLKEFEARKAQYEELKLAAYGILTGPGEESPSTCQVEEEFHNISGKWIELTSRLNSRADQIDQATIKSSHYKEVLQRLTDKIKQVGKNLASQPAVSTQPDAVKQQLQETSGIRSELEQLAKEVTDAQELCNELSALVMEPYFKDELQKRLDTVALPLKGMEDLASDRVNRLQMALSSSQQFQQMFDELRSCLDEKQMQHVKSPPVSAKLEKLQTLLHEQEEFQKSLNQYSGSYEMIVTEGESLLMSAHSGEERTSLQNHLMNLKSKWNELGKQSSERHVKLKDCLQKAQKYVRHVEDLVPWLEDCEIHVKEMEMTLDPVQLEAQLLRAKALQTDTDKKRSLLEMMNSAADLLIEAAEVDDRDILEDRAKINQRMDTITEELHNKSGSFEEMSLRLKELKGSFSNIDKKLEGARHLLEIFTGLGPQACSSKNLESMRSQQDMLLALEAQILYLRNLIQGLMADAPQGSDVSHLVYQAQQVQHDFEMVKEDVNECCENMETKLQGIGQFHTHVREMFSELADLDDELDNMGPVGRDIDSLKSQAEVIQTFLETLQSLKSSIESSESKCRDMLEKEGGPDLIVLMRELGSLNKQCSKLTERGKNRQGQLVSTLSRVEEFTMKLKELNNQIMTAEGSSALQGVVGTEVDTIKQQLNYFKVFQKEQVDSLQAKLHQVNGIGQGLIQSADKNCDVHGLEHDTEELNIKWNTLNKKVAERVTQLQEALLHCGKFQDALEPLLSWLTDTEDLIANQKPPSAEYKVVKAQIQEQKLLQRLLDDRRTTVEMIQAEGIRIAEGADPADGEKIRHQLEILAERWSLLLQKAQLRQKQLEDILVIAKQFHETTEPIFDWLSATEKKLANSEPIGTQTGKIQQQIQRHKSLEGDITVHETEVHQANKLGGSLAALCSKAEQERLSQKLEFLQARYSDVQDLCSRKGTLLGQALINARLFGEDEVEVLNWLGEVEDRLNSVCVKDYKLEVLQNQHKQHMALNEDIINRKKNVDQAIKNGQALLKQTTGEEVLLIQEKLDGIKTRYSEITSSSGKALKTLEQALQLASKFQATHDELNGWLRRVEDELAQSCGQPPSGDMISQFQQQQKELKKEAMEYRIVLDTINEVGSALLELVPWRAREGLDKLVADDNEQYRSVSDTIGQRVDQIDAAIQRSQQYEQAADAELAWVAETKRKLLALGPICLEQDQTTAQLQVQKAFAVDIIRHKDSIDELIRTEEEILATCGDEQKSLLQEKTKTLVQQYEDISHLHSERYARLERAQVLVGQFWETYEELIPWIEEMQVLLSQLPPPAVDQEMLRQQQEEMRQLRESVAEHKPHIDKLLKIGPHLSELNPEEGITVQEKYHSAEELYVGIKEEVRKRAMVLDDAVAQAAQIGEFHDKIGPMLETLESMASRLRIPPLIPAEVEKIRECISDNKNAVMELEKLQPAFLALKHRGEELISRSQGPDIDPAVKDIQDKLDQMVFFWEDIKSRADERESKFLDVLELAEKFWLDMSTLLTTIKDTHEIVHDLESPGIDPSMIKQQIEAADSIKEETDGLHEELEFIRILGADLIFACGETEKPEVKKSIDEMNTAWENLKRTWTERLEKLRDAMSNAVQYQDTLQAMFDWLDNAVIKLCDMHPVGTELNTVKEQIEEMKEFKVEVYQQQIEMEKLNHQGELMLKKAIDDTDRDIIKGPLTELKHLWENLGEKIAHRQQKLEDALLALGQFQHALAELMSWLTHTNELLNAQRAICGDPKVIEVELAKHHVLKNDVLAHQSTVQTVNKAGNELLESSARDDANSLRTRLETLTQLWETVLQKTEEREQQLEMALQQAQGLSGEIEDFIQWQTNIESQLLAAKPTGGLPETAREQLQAHMELYAEIKANEDLYRHLLDKGQLMLISRDDATGSITEQNVAILKRKWQTVSNKIEERKTKLEEALTLATDFQNSLQDFINWLTQAEQSLNIAPSPSLILDTVLFQIDEHKVFVNEVNIHREHIIELDKIGNQLKFLSQKQDVVLIKNLLLSVQSRWEKVVQRSIERGRSLDDARKRAKQFHEAWKKLIDWLEEAENHLDSDLEISNDPDKIKLQLTKHKEFQKTLGSKQPVYDTTVRTGRALKEKALLTSDVQKLDHLLGEVRDKWDTVCGKSVERQHKLEEALLFSGQFMDALQALVDWLYKVEPQLAEDQPLHGDLDLVMNLMDAHKVFQKELGKRTSSVQALKRSARELLESSREDTTWVKVQLQELSSRWDTVCKLSVSKQTHLEQALKQAEEFHTAVHMLLEWLSEAEQTLRFRGALPDDAESLQSLIDIHKEFMKKVEEKQTDVNTAVRMGEEILTMCHPDCITTIKHWITIIRARFEEVLTWGNQHQQRLQTALSDLMANSELLDELLSWIQWAETTLIQRDQDPMPQNIDQVKALISEHQVFMEEMTQKQPDVDRVTKTYKRKTTDPNHTSFNDKTRRKPAVQNATPVLPVISQPETKNPRINQLSAHWQQVWLLALERQRKLNDALDRLEELKEFANFDFDIWRKKYMRWMNHKKSRVMDFFRRIDKDQDGKITRQEFIDGILASKFPTTKLEMTAVADIFDQDGDGYIDYYEFVAALHPNKDAYRPTTDADKIEDEVTRQVAQCKCAKRFQVEQIGENKYRFFLGNQCQLFLQFGDSQQLRLVRILRSTVMVRVGGGWMALDEFLVKNDPCRARGRTNLELREKFILPEGVSQGMTPFRSRGRRSKPSSRTASPTRSSSSASQSNHSCTSVPSSPATPASGSKTPQHLSRCYEKPWLVNSKASTPIRWAEYPDFHTPSPEVTPAQSSKLKKAAVYTSRSSLTGETPTSSSAKSARADPKKSASRAGSRAGSRASSRRGSDASDFDLLETQSACSDTSESSAAGGSRRGLSKPSKIPTMSKKTASTPKTQGTKR